MIRERLPNNWLLLQNKEECYICEENKLMGKLVFDTFICSSCVEELGGE